MCEMSNLSEAKDWGLIFFYNLNCDSSRRRGFKARRIVYTFFPLIKRLLVMVYLLQKQSWEPVVE